MSIDASARAGISVVASLPTRPLESSNLDWSFTVEEAVFGTQAGTARAPQ
jgi:hypothetical protein